MDSLNPKHRARYIAAGLAWILFIFYLSSIPDLRSSFPSMIDLVLRKMAHMAEFGILFLLVRSMLHGLADRENFAALFAFLYAVADEWHQMYILGRVGSIVDVGFDTAGIALAMIAVFLVTKYHHRKNLLGH